MKLVVLTALLSVLLVSSTVYLIMGQSKTELMNLPSNSQYKSCIKIDFNQYGSTRWEKYQYAENICDDPKKFTILYQEPGQPAETKTTECLQKHGRIVLSYQGADLLSYTEEDCYF